MTNLTTGETIAATEIEQTTLHKIQRVLKNSSDNKTNKRARLVSPEGEEIELPDSVFRFLKELVYHLLRGQAVSVVPVNKEITTQEAADLLNVSRPYLISLLEKGTIPFKMVGTHRRISFEDLMAYKRTRDAERKQGLAELTQLSQELGLYD